MSEDVGLSKQELQTLLELARKEVQKVQDYGGDTSAVIGLLLIDLSLALKEQNRLLAAIVKKGT